MYELKRGWGRGGEGEWGGWCGWDGWCGVRAEGGEVERGRLERMQMVGMVRKSGGGQGVLGAKLNGVCHDLTTAGGNGFGAAAH